MEACEKILLYHGNNHIFNIGSGKGYSLQEILYRIEREIGKPIDIHYKLSRMQDVPANVLDNSLAKKELGWEPKIRIEDGIRKMHQLWNPVKCDFSGIDVISG